MSVGGSHSGQVNSWFFYDPEFCGWKIIMDTRASASPICFLAQVNCVFPVGASSVEGAPKHLDTRKKSPAARLCSRDQDGAVVTIKIA